MKAFLTSIISVSCIISSVFFSVGCSTSHKAQGPVPATYIMVCCHSMDRGTKFLVNGEWDSRHDYKDYQTALGLLKQIKDAGIKVVGIDFTNPAQWDGQKEDFFLMLDNVRRATKELSMEYFMFLGNTRAWTMSYWNEKARIVWETMVPDENYRRYGFGDDRPMMTIFLPGEEFKRHWDETPDSEKEWLAKFRIGTCQVNDPINFTETDAWGYRNMSESAGGNVRFVAPNSGVGPKEWKRIGPQEWKNRVEWSLGAKEYAVIGTYDDTCDAIFWGIADVSQAKAEVHVNDSTRNEPSAYYDIVKNALSTKSGASRRTRRSARQRN